MTAGLELMMVGMGTVFVFLTTLVIATTVMSLLVRRFDSLPVVGGEQVVEDDVVAAIVTAIARYRKRR